jgi:DNA-binding MarR family transcriptional regulator
MEKEGELIRKPDPEDGRARVLLLTKKGAQLAEYVDRDSAAHFQRVVHALDQDAPEVLRALQRFNDALSAVQSSPVEESS